MSAHRSSISSSRLASAGECWAAIRVWTLSRWLTAVAAGAVAALVIGVPTGIVSTSFYTRMTPVLWWNYPVWGASAALVGLTFATYVRARPAAVGPGRTVAASVLSTFAVGCPICNKLVVGLIGATGALTYWAPLQPILGIVSVAMLMAGLSMRIAGEARCPVPLHVVGPTR